MRGAINQFENLLLAEVKEQLHIKIEKQRIPWKLSELHKWLRTAYPYFHWIHLPRERQMSLRNLQGMIRSIDDSWVIKSMREGPTVMTPKQMKRQEQLDIDNAKRLRFTYCQLIECLASIGSRVDLSYMSSKWNDIIKVSGFKR